jgi:hypothetical protein
LTNTILKRKKPRKLDLTGVDAMLAFLTGIFGGGGAYRITFKKDRDSLLSTQPKYIKLIRRSE